MEEGDLKNKRKRSEGVVDPGEDQQAKKQKDDQGEKEEKLPSLEKRGSSFKEQVALSEASGQSVVLNVGGTTFQTYTSTLTKYPSTMLGAMFSSSMAKPNKDGQYFFDRNSNLFSLILDWYRNGGITRPTNIPLETLAAEVEFWGLPTDCIEEPAPPPPSKIYVALVLIQANRYDVITLLYEKVFSTRDEAITGGKKFFFDTFSDHWRDGLGKEYNFDKIEEYKEEFYYECYEDGDDPRGVGTTGGPYSLQVNEFIKQEDGSWTQEPIPIYTLPLSFRDQLSKQHEREQRIKQQREARQREKAKEEPEDEDEEEDAEEEDAKDGEAGK